VAAMMDVSDGLLIDAARMAAASGVAVTVDLGAVPLSGTYRAWGGDALAAATAGDDYELLFALAEGAVPPVPATRVGWFGVGEGLSLIEHGRVVALPSSLGFEHRGS
ncbi:AIR synthase-related protein, partial [Sphingomonas sp.]|uniref:AIR synthase-related protein n=1 Tax=Sphingomonas sp. TaxID=28214 RepID=UPI0035B2422D